MQAALHPVELFFPGPNVSLIGALLESGTDGANVQVAPGNISVDQIPIGQPLFVSLPSGAMVLQTPALVAGCARDTLILRYTGPGRLVQRRKSRRFPCAIPVNYRAIRDGQSHGAWKHAVTEDASEGGLALMIEGHLAFPTVVELQLALPGQAERFDASWPHGLDESHVRGDEVSGLVRFTGRACHGRFRPDGTTSVGVKFSAVNPIARLRLMRYLDTIAAGAPEECQPAV
jgi:hypothetical protein